jgi:hypothetical protein
MSSQLPSQAKLKWDAEYSHPLNELLSGPPELAVLVYYPETEK